MTDRFESEITSFLAVLPLAAFVKDEKGRLLYLNPAAEKQWNVKCAEARGKTLSEVLGLAEREVKAHDLKVFQLKAAHVSVYKAALPRSPLRSFMEFPVVDVAGHRLLGGVMVQWDG